MTMQAVRDIWPEGVRAGVSLSFDDARVSQLDRGIPILDRFGVRATFYVSLRLMEQHLKQWRAAAAGGHEIGNHTLNHPCSGNFSFIREHRLEDYTLERMEQELLEANDRIEAQLGVRPRTFAYPCGQSYVGRGEGQRSYVPLVAKHFEVGRGFRYEVAAHPLRCDMAMMPAIDLDRLGWEEVKSWLQTAAAERRWLIFAGHDIHETSRQGVRPQVLERLCAWCCDPSNQLWIGTVADIGAHLRRQLQV
jgi:peptidoglycan-N-acetylglucosamine deacetylase